MLVLFCGFGIIVEGIKSLIWQFNFMQLFSEASFRSAQ